MDFVLLVGGFYFCFVFLVGLEIRWKFFIWVFNILSKFFDFWLVIWFERGSFEILFFLRFYFWFEKEIFIFFCFFEFYLNFLAYFIILSLFCCFSLIFYLFSLFFIIFFIFLLKGVDLLLFLAWLYFGLWGGAFLGVYLYGFIFKMA